MVIEALGIQDVSRILNLSLDEVLEFVSLGYLPPVTGTDAKDYRFRMREVRVFAERFMGFHETDFDTALRQVERARPQPQASREIVDAAQLARGGVVEFSAHEERVQKVRDDKDALFTQYARYREQVGYRIGQLETMLQAEQRERAEVQAQSKQQVEKLELLKKKLLDARRHLEELERAHGPAPWWSQLLRRLRRG